MSENKLTSAVPENAHRRRRGSRRFGAMVVLIAIALLFSVSTAADAGAAPAPCINYVHREEAGRVEVDLRPDPANGGQFTTLTIFWFINDPVGRPGTYYWSHFLNNLPVGGNHFEVKDDNLHTIFRMGEGWKFGDVYKLQATHYAPQNRTTYIAVVNECTITPR